MRNIRVVFVKQRTTLFSIELPSALVQMSCKQCACVKLQPIRFTRYGRSLDATRTFISHSVGNHCYENSCSYTVFLQNFLQYFFSEKLALQQFELSAVSDHSQIIECTCIFITIYSLPSNRWARSVLKHLTCTTPISNCFGTKTW